MSRLDAPSFTPPRLAWLWGHRSPRAQRRLAQAVLGLSALLAVLALVAWRWAAQDAEREAAALMRRHTALQAASQGQPATAAADPAAPLSADQRRQFNQVVHALDTPWGPLLSALEAAGQPKVAVLSVEVQVERRAVRIQTEGPELEALLRHAEALQTVEPFRGMRLQRIDSEPAVAGQAARLSFDLELQP